MEHLTVEEARAIASWLMFAAHQAERDGHKTIQASQIDALEDRARAALEELAAATRKG